MKKAIKDAATKAALNKRVLETSQLSIAEVLGKFNNTINGYDEETVEDMRDSFGENIITHQETDSIYKKIYHAFINPFNVVLFLLAAVSLFTDVIFSSDEHNFTSVIIVLTLVAISGVLQLVQETRSGNAAEKLRSLINTTTAVERYGKGRIEIPLEEVVVGDIVYLAAGDMLPADVRIINAKDLFISQSSLTGESEPLEKFAELKKAASNNPLEFGNLAFMGSNVISGSAICVVIAVGEDTFFGSMAQSIMGKKVVTSFEKGVRSVSWLLIRFMLIMVPIVLFINGFTKGDWLEALLFALSVAVGLTPEMLPMIVTTNLAKGAVKMAKKKTVIKNLNSIQNFGAMDILCTDKTGTLTKDKIILEYHLDIRGNEDKRILRHAFLNSYHQTGLRNLMDIAILNHAKDVGMEGLSDRYHKVDEIPFDFNRRRMSVVVADENEKTQLITKGAVEEMLLVSSFAEYKGEVLPLTDDIKIKILNTVDDLNAKGMRVLAIAQKTNPPQTGVFSVDDESDMVLMGYLAFLDPPKKTAASAIKALNEYGVNVKILTGDNDAVTRCICRQVGLKVDNLMLGSDIEMMDDDELSNAVELANVFAKLSPQQKTRIVHALRENGHVVGFMGDGINDASAMKEADVGISVDTAVDIAKESADIILLEKDLTVLEQGVVEGRRTFGNIIKYIKMTISSNFGNIFSVLIASAFLPFLPMMPIQILVLNLIYNISCLSIPWDHMDQEYLKKPRKWDASSITRFALWIGPTSSIFDITTYLFLFFIICPSVCGGSYSSLPPDKQVLFVALFNAGWFVESLWSQTLVIHMIRTPKIPFLESRAALPVLVMTCLAVLAGTLIPYSPLGKFIKLGHLPLDYFPWLLGTILCYMVVATLMKNAYIKKYKELL